MRVLLVHGLSRTPLSLLGLRRDLRRGGHRPSLVGYSGTFERFDAIVARLRRRMVEAAEPGEPVAVVCHSLGGVLVRAALAGWPAGTPLPARVVMLGPPNRPPQLAARFARRPLFRLVNGECGQLLARREFYASLPELPDAVEVTIVAGTKGWPRAVALIAREPNDGVVAVSETRLERPARVVELPVSHTFMMHDRRVRAAVLAALARSSPRHLEPGDRA